MLTQHEAFLNRKAIELTVNRAPLPSDNIRDFRRTNGKSDAPPAVNAVSSEEIRKQSNCERVSDKGKKGCEGKIKEAAPLCG